MAHEVFEEPMSEARLLERFEQRLPASGLWPHDRSRTLTLLREVDGMHGRVDLLAGTVFAGAELSPKQALLLSQPTCARLLQSLSGRQGKSIETLQGETSITVQTIRRWLSDLVEAEMCHCTGDGLYIRRPLVNIRVEICSFEGKLRNWARALYQATRYRTFSHRSFVVMPREWIKPALRNIDRFRRAKVGLVSVSHDGNIQIYSRPRARQPRCPVMFQIAAGRVLQKILG